jgi:hypothetical protein
LGTHLRHVSVSFPPPAHRRRPAKRFAPSIVSDSGDDHEMAEEFGNSLARAGDRVIGFATGIAVLGFAWAIWFLT